MYYHRDRDDALKILAANHDRDDKPELENLINAISIFKYENSSLSFLVDNDNTLAEFVCHSFWAGRTSKK